MKSINRVQDIANVSKLKPDLAPLRKAIQELQTASITLDVEKVQAEKEFRKLLKRIQKRRGFFCLKYKIKKIVRWIKEKLGSKTKKCHDDVSERTPPNSHLRLGRYFGWVKDKKDKRKGDLPRKFIEAAKRVKRVNKKLASFEKGFISQDGIKDREWLVPSSL